MNRVTELQDVANWIRATHGTDGWLFTAHVHGNIQQQDDSRFLGIAESSDPDFLVAATKLIVEAKRMREAAR